MSGIQADSRMNIVIGIEKLMQTGSQQTGGFAVACAMLAATNELQNCEIAMQIEILIRSEELVILAFNFVPFV
jgi:hypothetical protein